jgi:cell division protein FtsZ
LLLIVSGNEITIDEIGRNQWSYSNRRVIMLILSWELWRRITWDAIAVTIIATGFDIEQQNEL